jgi:hypothetical protein
MQYFAVRAFTALVVAVLVAIGAGVGIEAASLTTGPRATVKTAIGSLGASPYLEIALSGASGSLRASLGEIGSAVVTIDVASADGATPLRGQSSATALDAQVSVADGSSDLADLRIVGGRQIYLRVFFSALAKLPALPASTRASLGNLGALIGGTWFSIPTALLSKIGGSSGASSPVTPPLPTRTRARDAMTRLETDLLNITTFSSSSSPAGTTTTATASVSRVLTVVLRDAGPAITAVLPSAAGTIAKDRQLAATTSGHISAQVITDGTDTMRAATLSISSPHDTASLRAAIAHQPLEIGVPAGARSLPAAILRVIARQLARRAID